MEYTAQERRALMERRREAAVENLRSYVGSDEFYKKAWEVMGLFQDCPFTTAKGLEFCYRIRGNEMFISRKEKSVTRSSVEIALERVVELEGHVAGPKKLGVFGASYLYPVFLRIGLIEK